MSIVTRIKMLLLLPESKQYCIIPLMVKGKQNDKNKKHTLQIVY
jgi:hypothetical protein